MITTRKLMISMALALVSICAMSSESNGASLNERFYNAKYRELVYRLHITAEQQQRFEPIYREYCEEMIALWVSRTQPLSPSTSSKAAAIEKRKMEIQQRAQGIRMKYIDKFATVLNALQIEQFYEVESEIQKKLKQRRDQARNQ